MRRCALALLMVVAFQLAAPAPAHASIFWRWIDEFSGPGPYGTVGIAWSVLCLPRPDDSGDWTKVSPTPTPDEVWKILGDVLGSSCIYPRRVRAPLLSVDFETSGSFPYGGSNNQPYATTTDKTVRLVLFEPTISWHVDPDATRDALKIGVGVGKMRLSTGGGEFSSFYKTFYEPIRVDVKPLAFRNSGSGIVARFRAAFGVTAELIIVPDGFTAAEFGAGGTFQTSSEKLKSFGVSLDVLKLLGK